MSSKLLSQSKSLESEIDISLVSGNGSAAVKTCLQSFLTRQSLAVDWKGSKRSFADNVCRHMRLKEVSLDDKAASEGRKKEGRVVCLIRVAEEMLNGGGNIHGGCSATLIDVCSTMALIAYSVMTTGEPTSGVSQSLNVVYHSPAALNDELKIINTTMTVGARAQSIRTEIWNITHHRLVASGVHVKMSPSAPSPVSNNAKL